MSSDVGRPAFAVDLYSGTGGATAAFRARGWQVVRVDLCHRRAATVVADCRHLPIARRPDLLWASPPCTEFSDANPRVKPLERRPSLELVVAVLAAVRDLRPRFWVLENVRGAIPFLGIPVQKIGPWCLWGYFPPIRVTLAMQTHLKQLAGRSAVARAAIPFDLSSAVCDAVEAYWSVPSLLDMRPFRKHRHRAVTSRLPAAAEGLGL